MGIILSTFKGCGKTYFQNMYGNKVKTVDIGKEYGEKSNYDDFADKILSVVNDYDIVFISATPSQMNALTERNVDFDVFYPSKERRKEFIENCVRKHERPNEIRALDQNFDKMIDEIESVEPECCYKHKLENFGEFIGNAPVIMQYVESLKNNNENKKTNE